MATHPQGKFQSIQAVRAAAANAVVISHIIGLHSRLYPSLLPYENAANWLGKAGVYCFFLISGFVVVRSAGASWRHFAWSRFARVFPIYWIYLALSLAFVCLWQREHVDLAQIAVAASLTAIQDQPIMPVAWSLVFEVYFYVVVGLMVALNLNLRLGLWIWAAAVILLGPVLPFFASPLTLIFIAGGLFSCVRSATLDRTLSVPAPRLLGRIGDASYSLYLCHFLVVAALSRLLFMVWPGHLLASAVICFVASNIVALLSYRCLERPILNWLNRGRHVQNAVRLCQRWLSLPARPTNAAAVPAQPAAMDPGSAAL